MEKPNFRKLFATRYVAITFIAARRTLTRLDATTAFLTGSGKYGNDFKHRQKDYLRILKHMFESSTIL
jgi:hypothetical protein